MSHDHFTSTVNTLEEPVTGIFSSLELKPGAIFGTRVWFSEVDQYVN